MDIKGYLADIISKAIDNEKFDTAVVKGMIALPPDDKMGDFAFPCFVLAKEFRKAPPMIAASIKDAVDTMTDEKDLISKTEVAGGYLNFYLNRKVVISGIIAEINEQGENYGKSDEGAGKKVIVEFSSPNIAKPFHIGHLVSTAVGSSVERIYKFLGYDTVKVNHLGDWGTQFGKLISAYKRWGNEADILKDPINELLKIYVRFHNEAEKNPELEDEARGYFKKLEDGDKEVTELWQFFVKASLSEFNRMYDKLGISFDSYAGESFYSDKMPEIVQILKDKNILEESDGAMVVRFPEEAKIPPCIILKSDGSTIYATRDIAAAVYRKRHYDFYKNIYVVGTPQALHFKQVFSVIDKMGFNWSDSCVHVGFGYVRFPDRVISTRHGDVVLLEDVLNEAVDKTKEIIINSPTGKVIDDIDFVSEKIGIGAVLYAFLKNGRERDIIFTWEDMLDFEGESGPYVQYSYARGKSVLRKAEEAGIYWKDADLTLLDSDEEFSLVKHLNNYQSVVR
ncbi:MAG: arginine--tRNA ligase, partial [Clostridia bacterium]|nr:arginine--tRNA ligase [Clostridia bacterium]